MQIRIQHAQLVDELVHYLRRAGCVAARTELEAHGAVTVDVQLPAALDPEQARLELEVYLKVFEATHPGYAADLLA